MPVVAWLLKTVAAPTEFAAAQFGSREVSFKEHFPSAGQENYYTSWEKDCNIKNSKSKKQASKDNPNKRKTENIFHFF